MRSILIFAIAAASLAWLVSCGPSSNKQLVFEIGGPCDECPANRIDTILNPLMDGIAEIQFDEKNGQLRLGIDSTVVSAQQIINALTDNGYNVDLDVAHQFSFWCCRMDDGEAMLLIDDDLGEDEELLNELDKDFAETEDLMAEDDLDKQLNELMDDKAFAAELDEELMIDESDFDVTIDDSELEGRRRNR